MICLSLVYVGWSQLRRPVRAGHKKLKLFKLLTNEKKKRVSWPPLPLGLSVALLVDVLVSTMVLLRPPLPRRLLLFGAAGSSGLCLWKY